MARRRGAGAAGAAAALVALLAAAQRLPAAEAQISDRKTPYAWASPWEPAGAKQMDYLYGDVRSASPLSVLVAQHQEAAGAWRCVIAVCGAARPAASSPEWHAQFFISAAACISSHFCEGQRIGSSRAMKTA
jgi:hypothetical protein